MSRFAADTVLDVGADNKSAWDGADDGQATMQPDDLSERPCVLISPQAPLRPAQGLRGVVDVAGMVVGAGVVRTADLAPSSSLQPIPCYGNAFAPVPGWGTPARPWSRCDLA